MNVACHHVASSNECKAFSVGAEALSRYHVPTPTVLMSADRQQGVWLLAAAASLLGWYVYRRRSGSKSIYGELDGAHPESLLCMGLCIVGS
jgi:hypothetical protein